MKCVKSLMLVTMVVMANCFDISFVMTTSSSGSSSEDFWIEVTHVSDVEIIVGNLSKPKATKIYNFSYPYPPAEEIKMVRVGPYEQWPTYGVNRTYDGDGAIIDEVYLNVSGTEVRFLGENRSTERQWVDYFKSKDNLEAVFYPPHDPTAAPTNVPTDVPPTEIPSTGIPPTSIPQTNHPDTEVPRTPAPIATPTVTLVLTETVTEAVPVVTAVPTAIPTNIPTGVPTPEPTTFKHPSVPAPVGNAAAVGAAISSGGAAAGSAMRLVLISGGCQLGGGENRDLVKDFHFTGVEINNSKALGSIVVHFASLIALLILFKLTSLLLAKCFPRSKGFYNANDPDGFLRFPSAPLIVFQWMYQGTTLCGFLLLFYSGNVIGITAGILCIVGCLTLPLLLMVVLKKAVPVEGVYIEDSKKRGKTYMFMLGRGEWLSRFRDNHWTQKYASVIRSLREDCLWYSVVELCSSFVLSLMSSLELDSKVQCGHVRVGQGLIFVILMLLEAVYLPHCKPRDCILSFVMSGGQATALFLLAVAFYHDSDESTARVVAEKVLGAVSILLFVQVSLDVGCEIFVFFSRRREDMQRQFWSLVECTIVDVELPLTRTQTSFRSLFTHQDTGSLLLPLPSTGSAFQVASTMSDEASLTELC